MMAEFTYTGDADPPDAGARGRSQTRWVVVAMLFGVAIGFYFPDGPSANVFHATDLQLFSSVFLRMIKSLIAPLVFATLVVGIAGHSDDMKRVGKLALRSIFYFEIVTTLALIVGLTIVNVVKPGRGVNLGIASDTTGVELAHATPSLSGMLEHVVPQSIVDAAARNDALQIVFFTILFAVALSHVQGPPKRGMLSFCECLSEVMLKFVGIVMKFAPVGIGAAVAVPVGRSGLGVLANLGALVLTLYGALVVFALLVLLPITFAFKVPIRRFCRSTWTAPPCIWPSRPYSWLRPRVSTCRCRSRFS